MRNLGGPAHERAARRNANPSTGEEEDGGRLITHGQPEIQAIAPSRDHAQPRELAHHR